MLKSHNNTLLNFLNTLIRFTEHFNTGLALEAHCHLRKTLN